MVKRWVELFKFWLRLRRANKQLLDEVAKHRSDPKYAPPTRGEVLDFIHGGKVDSYTLGPIPFRHAMGYQPEQRPYYTFPKE